MKVWNTLRERPIWASLTFPLNRLIKEPMVPNKKKCFRLSTWQTRCNITKPIDKTTKKRTKQYGMIEFVVSVYFKKKTMVFIEDYSIIIIKAASTTNLCKPIIKMCTCKEIFTKLYNNNNNKKQYKRNAKIIIIIAFRHS